MAEVRPFRGWRYNGDVSALIAPPYDILDVEGKQALLEKSPDNIVGVDLPVVPASHEGPAEAYEAAGAKLAALKDAGTLVQDDAPALYAYSQTYTWAGVSHTRRALICGVRATEFYDAIWPHEHTFAGPKADRLKLTQVTRTQLSSIFGFFSDTGGASHALWDAADRSDPVVEGELDGVVNRLWAVTDPAAVAAVREAMADVPIFIADGHHRYTTTMNYGAALRAAGEIDADHEANFVLFTLVAMDDPGLLVLPTHRMISGITDGYDCKALVAETKDFMDWKAVAVDEGLTADADSYLKKTFGPGAMAFLDAKREHAYIGRLSDSAAMADAAPDECETWRGLDVAVLHRLLLERYVAPHVAGEAQPTYTAEGGEVLAALADGRCQLAAMLQGTPLAAVRDIALARAIMPHKSTYFYPKLATGMVLKPLE